MRNQIISIVLACQMNFFGCSHTMEVRRPIADVTFVSADEAWVVTTQHGLGHLSADGVFENATESPGPVNILSPSDGRVAFSVWHIPTPRRRYWMVSPTDNGRWRPTAIDFADENVGWIRTLGPLFLTEDGGQNWTQILKTGPGELKGLFVADRDTAYIYGDNEVRRTTDRGRTWESRAVGIDTDLTAFVCRDGHPDDCWAGTGQGEVFVTADRDTFERLLLPQLSREISVSSISLTGVKSGLVAGYSIYNDLMDARSFGVLFVTDDNGETWKSLEVPNDHLMKVAAFGDTYWLASYSRIYRSTDAGKTWNIILQRTVEGFE